MDEITEILNRRNTKILYAQEQRNAIRGLGELLRMPRIHLGFIRDGNEPELIFAAAQLNNASEPEYIQPLFIINEGA
jgi:hypothetical protein